MDNSKKPNISKKKKEQLSKNILETLKKKKECEKKALDIVIELIDGGLEEADLLNKLHSINPSYYEDVVEERFILKQCGYVMCKKKLEYIPNQKYKISLALKKVYDISERKKFCSNICFKSSKYLQNQLLTTPLWLREKDAVPTFKLLNIHTEEDIASHLHTKPDGHTKSSTPLITIPTPSDTKTDLEEQLNNLSSLNIKN
ncbi:putative RNA polymerase II subunit B1 CTD phosphatase RPAP2 homolog [Acyrthosiphon pisum]|uniref:RNA polymerase II subunit B1 CTD phosphatase RPAP2 homolog n=1 Tax=Acyrthosiphon pisum TaxID=7029 RepID=A0A8R2A3G6_ACYPI|nr:putative RNA polymerase II subunit B1 CTD phosphatase RPAP2 homolog [Acyrthosiphon pisum]|eukprot:XP_001950425.1 PREDICTED: putative RNA polymerase II subunit B1 CTD phosphatase RPAP2 homolog [Acyrthosiphon pisum]